MSQWLQALSAVRRLPGPRPGGEVSPFRGLASFETEHARFFCGRGAMCAELADLVHKAALAGSPTVMVGPSGSGKSSLLRAGNGPAIVRPLQSPVIETWYPATRYASLTKRRRCWTVARAISTLLCGPSPRSSALWCCAPCKVATQKAWNFAAC
ncbi:hypothetical protein [Amycolatopsis sp. CA-128772]|uniref:nSTAND1 domain-containing NTPase n=1 Tax=Amycolatopsis sp. CA-128772 TaxID=2073159 RepID=UPI00351A5A2A